MVDFVSVGMATRVIDAAYALLARCDGAHELDGMGFNKPDAMRVRSILQNPQLDFLQIADLYDRLPKYKRQLQELGITLEDLELPEGLTHRIQNAYVRQVRQDVKEKAPIPEPPAEYKQVVFPFGKFSGQTLYDIASSDKGRNYLQWIVDCDPPFKQPWRGYAKAALAGAPIEISKDAAAKPVGATTSAEFVQISTRTIAVYFPRALKDAFKEAVPGRRWNMDEARWEIPHGELETAIQFFEQRGIPAKLDADCEAARRESKARQAVRDDARTNVAVDLEIPGLLHPPFGYQRGGVQFLVANNGRGLIADEMGLGKSLQFIAYVMYRRATEPDHRALIVGPAAVKINWAREIEKFTGLPVCLWSTQGPEGDLSAPFHVTNYEALLPRDGRYPVVEELRSLNFTSLCCDEAHMLKDRKSQRSQALFGAANRRDKEAMKRFPGIPTRDLVLLTGTPVLNRPAETYTLCSYLDPSVLGSFFTFANRYGAWAKGNLARRPSTPQNLDELHERTKKLILRRLQRDVQKDMPELLTVESYVELTDQERKEYRRLFREMVGAWGRRPSLQAMHTLQEWLNTKKLARVWELIEEFQENGHTTLLFSTRLDPLRATLEKFGSAAALITGDMSLKRRQVSIDRLQQGEATVGCLSIRAAGVGINLTAATRVIMLDLEWVPALHQQAVKRAHRTGQTETVVAYYTLVRDTIEEIKYATLQEKLGIADQIIDGRKINRQVVRGVFATFMQKLRDSKEIDFLTTESDLVLDDVSLDDELLVLPAA